MIKTLKISIHASRGGSDLLIRERHGLGVAFQSTLPAGEATTSAFSLLSGNTDFNPRFPRGKRLRGKAIP